MFEAIGTFIASPFGQTVIATLGAALAADYAAFRSFKSYQEFSAYSWGVAAWRGGQGLVVGIVSALTLPAVGEFLKRLGVFLLVVGWAGSLTACASRAGVAVSPEGTAALRANQVVQALRTVITPEGASPIEQLVAAKVLTPADAVQVVTGIRQAFVYAGDLAEVLRIADTAQDAAARSAGLQKAAVLVQSIAEGLAAAPLSIGQEEGRQKVAALLRVASSLLLTVGSVFPSTAAPDPAAFAF